MFKCKIKLYISCLVFSLLEFTKESECVSSSFKSRNYGAGFKILKPGYSTSSFVNRPARSWQSLINKNHDVFSFGEDNRASSQPTMEFFSSSARPIVAPPILYDDKPKGQEKSMSTANGGKNEYIYDIEKSGAFSDQTENLFVSDANSVSNLQQKSPIDPTKSIFDYELGKTNTAFGDVRSKYISEYENKINYALGQAKINLISGQPKIEPVLGQSQSISTKDQGNEKFEFNKGIMKSFIDDSKISYVKPQSKINFAFDDKQIKIPSLANMDLNLKKAQQNIAKDQIKINSENYETKNINFPDQKKRKFALLIDQDNNMEPLLDQALKKSEIERTKIETDIEEVENGYISERTNQNVALKDQFNKFAPEQAKGLLFDQTLKQYVTEQTKIEPDIDDVENNSITDQTKRNLPLDYSLSGLVSGQENVEPLLSQELRKSVKRKAKVDTDSKKTNSSTVNQTKRNFFFSLSHLPSPQNMESTSHQPQITTDLDQSNIDYSIDEVKGDTISEYETKIKFDFDKDKKNLAIRQANMDSERKRHSLIDKTKRKFVYNQAKVESIFDEVNTSDQTKSKFVLGIPNRPNVDSVLGQARRKSAIDQANRKLVSSQARINYDFSQKKVKPYVNQVKRDLFTRHNVPDSSNFKVDITDSVKAELLYGQVNTKYAQKQEGPLSDSVKAKYNEGSRTALIEAKTKTQDGLKFIDLTTGISGTDPKQDLDSDSTETVETQTKQGTTSTQTTKAGVVQFNGELKEHSVPSNILKVDFRFTRDKFTDKPNKTINDSKIHLVGVPQRKRHIFKQNRKIKSGSEKYMFATLKNTTKQTNLHRKDIVIPIIVLACNRITVKRCLDQLILYRTDKQKFPIIVSQDCHHNETHRVIKSFISKHPNTRMIKQPNQSEIPRSDRKGKGTLGYFKIARHYRFALSYALLHLNYDAVIMVEDDLDIAPDFFEYFEGTYPLLVKDRTIWCVSAWNDNGKAELIDQNRPDLLHRTDYFPGLGWMMRKETFMELKPKWPKTDYDVWLRDPNISKGRSCIRPEISRTYTFGQDGVSSGLYWNEFLKYIYLNKDFVRFTKQNLTYLLKEHYDRILQKQVEDATEMMAYQVPGLQPPSVDQKNTSIKILYKNARAYNAIAATLGLMLDTANGIPRTGYKGIVQCFIDGRRIYIVPDFNYTIYNPEFNFVVQKPDPDFYKSLYVKPKTPVQEHVAERVLKPIRDLQLLPSNVEEDKKGMLQKFMSLLKSAFHWATAWWV